MARSGPLSWGRDLLRPIDLLTMLWSSSAALPPVAAGAAAAYRTLFVTVRRLVVGRRLSVRLDRGDITLTVAEFDSRLDLAALAVGQLDNVRFVATDLRWDDNRLNRAVVTMHNVHVRPGVPPVMVAAPVHMSLDVPAAVLDELLRWVTPKVAGEVDADAVARLRWARRPMLGGVEVDARLDGAALRLKPRGLALRRRRWSLPAWLPEYRIALPELPHGLRLTGVSLGPGSVRLTGTLPEWRMDMPWASVEDVLSQLNSMGRTLNLTAIRWRSPLADQEIPQ